jgi:hypothetical protein
MPVYQNNAPAPPPAGAGIVASPTQKSFAARMAEMLQRALRESPAALLTVTVDGQTVTYTRKQAIDELQFWERRAAREAGRRPIVAQIGMEF